MNLLSKKLIYCGLLLFACHSSADTLQPMQCDALLAEVKAAQLKAMQQQMAQNKQDALRWGVCRYRYYDDVMLNKDMVVTAITPAPAAETSTQGGDDQASEYSDTNNQVAGVAEADFIQNDGKYIYVLAKNKFRIVQAWPVSEAREIAQLDIEGQAKKMFVYQNKVLIYSSLDVQAQNQDDKRLAFMPVYQPQECTYGYDCAFNGDGLPLKMTLLDISDVNKPQVMQQWTFSGSYLNARRVDNAVYSAVVFPKLEIKGLQYWPDDSQLQPHCDGKETLSSGKIESLFDELTAKNEAVIKAVGNDDLLPHVYDHSRQQNQTLVDCEQAYRAPTDDSQQFIALVSLDLNQSDALQTTSLYGKSGAIYASDSALYLSAPHDNHWETGKEVSTLYKFALKTNPISTEYVASGEVKGRVLNQFSMDEYQDHFRIATTTGQLGNEKVHSTLTVLKQNGKELQPTGQVDNIAVGEDIRSARFVGEKAYVVTFKKTDPLFVFDLSQPTDPKIAGELKIPGFSTYIHPLDAEHLLSIGYDASDEGNFSLFQGISLQLFDVSDMKKPLLLHKEVIGTRGSSSEAVTNHLAFNYFAPQKLLAIPMTICEKGLAKPEPDPYYPDLMTFSGLLVYKIDTTKGFELIGGVPHVAPESMQNFRYSCGNWWTQANSYVKRSVFMDDFVFSVTEDAIKANALAQLNQDVAVIHFDTAQCDESHVDLCQILEECAKRGGLWQENQCELPPYAPERDSPFSPDVCQGHYRADTGELELPCVNVADQQFHATLNNGLQVTQAQPLAVDYFSPHCEIQYNAQNNSVTLPCIQAQGQNYWVNLGWKNGHFQLLDYGNAP